MTDHSSQSPDNQEIDVFWRIRRACTTSSKAKALIAALDFCQSIPQPASCTPAEYDRQKYALSVTAVAMFLESAGRRDLFARFQELASGLSDLNNETIRPFLKTSSLRTRADPSNIWRARSYVAMAADALQRSGKELKAIARIISTEFPQLSVLVQKGKTLHDSVLSWRDQFKKGTVKNWEANLRYRQYLEQYPQGTSVEDLAAFARTALDSAVAEAGATVS